MTLNILGNKYSDENYYIIINAYDRLFTSLSPTQKTELLNTHRINVYRDYEEARETTLRSWISLSLYTKQSLQSLIFNRPFPFEPIPYPKFKRLLELYSSKTCSLVLPRSKTINSQLSQLRHGHTNMFPLTIIMDISNSLRIPIDILIK